MPRQLVRARAHDRDRSLGWLGTAWMEALVVHGPGDVQGEPVVHGDEYTGFIVDCYGLDKSGRRLYDSAFISRPKGCNKSGLEAEFSLYEALGPCRFAGWAKGGEVYRDPWGLGFTYEYQPGEPMGRPVKVPFIRCMATEEGQTGNVYDTVFVNLTTGPLSQAMRRKDNAGLTRIVLPEGGEIRPSTASSAAKDGGKETFLALDETHLYKTPELRRMYATVTRNLRKRKKIAETWYLEGTTMFAEGENSSAEETYKLAEQIAAKKTRRERLLFDHRWGECEDLSDEKALMAALVDSYGDAASWNHLPGIVDEILDPRADPVDSVRYFLNAKSSALDAWLTEPEWFGCRVKAEDGLVIPDKRDAIVLGFDGSRKRARGVTDATALIGCRVSDGYLWEIEVWEQPPGVEGENWQVPDRLVNARVRDVFAKHNVIGLYADPAKWETYVASWEADFASRLKVKVTRDHPMEWWMTGGRSTYTVRALAQFESAVHDREVVHDGSRVLTQHILNARRKHSTAGVQIGKSTPTSDRKIDGAVAAVLAWQARLDALAGGHGVKKVRSAPKRIR